MLSVPPVDMKPCASSGAWKRSSAISTTSSSICLTLGNARLPPSAFSEKNSMNASRPTSLSSSVALKTKSGTRPCCQSASPSFIARIAAITSFRERPFGGKVLRIGEILHK